MNSHRTVRIAAALASVCITLVLFSAVVSLKDTPQTDAGTPLAATHTTAGVAAGRPVHIVDGNARRPKLPA